jgi:LacI family transcriptional regulator
VVSIKEIAQLTRVSTATVSNVLNGKKGAAGEAKAREIRETARSLHYTPNALAKSLKQQKTNNIGIITEDLTVFNTPEIVDGIDAYCESEGYEIILGNMRLFKRYNNDFTDTVKHQQILDAAVRNMLAKQVEGIVYVGYHCREIPYLPSRVNVPFVYAYCYPREDIYPSVLYDDEGAAYGVTELLIKKGHTRIGAVCGPEGSFHTQARLRGFKQALLNHGIPVNPAIILYGDWERGSGYRLSEALFDAGVTAIFSFNDLMASGVYERAAGRGLVIGGDISLVGFDNRDISLGYTPQLATVEPPLNEIGRKCAELILNQLKRRRIRKKRIYLPCIIHERKSVSENRAGITNRSSGRKRR